MEPIWKEHNTILGTAESAQWRIKTGGKVIYNGVAYKRPGAAKISVEINSICADYIVQPEVKLKDKTILATGVTCDFVVEVLNGSTWKAVETVTYINDWSYDSERDAEYDGIDASINGYYDREGWLLHPYAPFALGDSSTTVDIYTNGVATDTFTVTSEDSGVLMLDMSKYPNADMVDVDGVIYKPTVMGVRYSLFYLNAFGGFDTFVPQGRVVEKDTYSRNNYKPATHGETGRRNTATLVNNITKKYTIVSGWLSDAQSQRMHHLLGSTCAYMYDNVTRQLTAVTIGASECTYKTYGSEDNRLVSYTFEVEVAEDRRRR